MTRRPPLTVIVVALLAVSWSLVTSEPRSAALAADPQTELAQTQQQLANAQASQRALQNSLAQQRAHLAQLEAQSAALSAQLDVAKAELAQITAEHDRVAGLLTQVREQVDAIAARLASLEAEIERLDGELQLVAADIRRRTVDLHAREDLLEDHLRSAYEQSRTTLLEVLLSADSLDEATTQVGYLLSVSDEDVILADEIRTIREELGTRQAMLREGQAAVRVARAAARDEHALLEARQAELSTLEAQLAELAVAAEQKRAEQEAALNAALQVQGNVAAQIAENERAAGAAASLSAQLRTQAAVQRAAIAEAQRRAAAEAARNDVSSYGFRWPEANFHVTQEWGPTSFALEPPYTYHGTYYPHFHGGIDIANGCGTPIMATGPGVVVASGQPLMPFDSGYGVVIDHGNDVQSWYWHLKAQVVVSPGQIVTGGNVVGYEGTTGYSTGCHLHFAINQDGVWENPRNYLP